MSCATLAIYGLLASIDFVLKYGTEINSPRRLPFYIRLRARRLSLANLGHVPFTFFVILLITRRGCPMPSGKKVPRLRVVSSAESIDRNAKRMSKTEILEPDPPSRGAGGFAITPNMQLPSKWILTHPLPRPPANQSPRAPVTLRSRVECTEHFTRPALWP